MYDLVGFIDTYEWTKETNACEWVSQVNGLFFKLELEVCIRIQKHNKSHYENLYKCDRLDTQNHYSLIISLSCRNEDNPLYRKFLDEYGNDIQLSLSKEEDFIRAKKHLNGSL